MRINSATKPYQVAELMGAVADDIDGRIMLGLLLDAGFSDTGDVGEIRWFAMLDNVRRIRANLDARVADEMRRRRLGL